ncbi:uroporphyrinogen-III C-methyltransferase [Staphylococcus caeli]|uniref:uroporphyrinogen-III C-methyltransferase n=1 Tax=Staphylococcus caeli TaxID=2201815 RepID=A0A1D4M215_9STAP|nr:uroporphyrinogen-III C-methyltransferase [Staphylococcus caeli]SCS81711.1 uroporphyrin-III C-methyltransferase [Staphylococcus caeli]SCS92536.1 uroporphyrin-III C-methyltransferase [Staphylococcus caeli]
MSLNNQGTIFFIGAGPGNPELLTKKAVRLIKSADIVLYDRLVNPFILQLIRPETEIIDVGKKPYHKHIQQQQINEQIVTAAQNHRCVVRLKGGDPAIFGRVHEEISAIRQYDIDFEVIPGITTASATVASLGLGLTIRNIASKVTFTTGHFKDDNHQTTDVTSLLNGGTLAIYMGVKRLKTIMHDIYQATQIDYPVIIVFNVSSYNEKYYYGTVKTIHDQVANMRDTNTPGMIIVGEIADASLISKSIKEKNEQQRILVSGPREKALDKAFELYEEGHWCVINPIDFKNAHASQQELLRQLTAENYDAVIDVV